MCVNEGHKEKPRFTKQPSESVVYKLFFFVVMVAFVCNVRARAPLVSLTRAGADLKVISLK